MPTKKKKTASFEDNLSELETLVEAMEHEQLPLETLLSHYEKGNQLLTDCQSLLNNARERIELIKAEGKKETQNKLATDSTKNNDAYLNNEVEPDDDIRLL